ncbi:MAG: carotenoid biosynthesis protein [Opitutaceae bacterium]|nr:carotenoid biosynthesis protein [Cytophagales bacterium]
MERKETRIAAIVIIVTYLVGIFGFAFQSTKSLFVILVPFHLLLVFGILMYLHKSWNLKFVIFLFLTFIISFSAEYIGVHTGLLFGDYYYGNVLGLKLGGIPLLIGINWIMLVYITHSISSYFSVNILVSTSIAAILMTFLDIIMEPGAIKLGFWHWTLNSIPVYNYVSWFVLSFLLTMGAKFLKVKTYMFISLIVFISQLMFFVALY